MRTDSHSDEQLKNIYKSYNRIAVVGMSKNEEKAAGYVPRYLMAQGYAVTPVNPTADQIMGYKSFQKVSQIQDPVDIVDIFRPSDDVLEVVKDAVTKPGIKLIWMQEGIYNEEAEKLAKSHSIDVIYNRCMMAEHKRLFADHA